MQFARLLCAVFRLFFRLALFLVMGIVAVPQGAERIAIPKEGCYEPQEQQGRYRNRHDHVLDLMTQVHEFSNNIECFCAGEYNEYPIQQQFRRKSRCIVQNGQYQFHNGDDQ